ncbi:hypothetical protein F4680DRAFT_426433 [Xylaria scruposa]|nr:hypothetical protein F4680DRAFT_426433 [Xylaria scruposa]
MSAKRHIIIILILQSYIPAENYLRHLHIRPTWAFLGHDPFVTNILSCLLVTNYECLRNGPSATMSKYCKWISKAERQRLMLRNLPGKSSKLLYFP